MEAKWYQRFIGMVFVVSLCCWNFQVEGEKAILLDKNQNSSWHWLTRFEFGPWSGWSRDGNNGGYTVCDLSETAANHTNSWLVSEYVDLQDANEVHVEFTFVMRQCPSGLPYCKHSFKVYELQTNEPLVGGITKTKVQSGQFTLVDTVNATHFWTPGNAMPINRVNLSFIVSRTGVYLAFQDTGACIALMSVTLSYTYCPSTVNHGVVLKKTPVPSSSQHNVTVSGSCAGSASPYPSNSALSLACLSSGKWVTDDKVTCLCTAGYELVEDTCTGCQAGFYKGSIGNGKCTACPSNSVPSSSRDSCPCKNGFYRAPQDATNDSCTAPPSEPRNINITVVADGVVIVTWSRPAFDGGREDITYDLLCSACSNMGSCSNSCFAAQFWPSKTDLISSQVTISNLDSVVVYNITVVSKNEVSDQAGQSSLRYLHKTFSFPKTTTSNPPSTTLTFPMTTDTVTNGNLTTVTATLTPEHGTSSYSKVSAAIGISVAVTFVICFLIAAIVIFLMLKTWRRKQLEQRSVHSSSTQLSDLPREGTPLKRNRSVTTAAELMGNGSAIDLRDLKRSPPLPAIKIRDANSNSRPSSSSSSDWLPMKRSGRLPALNWTPPRSITPVLLPSEVRRKQSVPPSILPIDLGESAHSTLSLSPRRPPEGSDLSKPERSASVNSWFPAKEVQYNV